MRGWIVLLIIVVASGCAGSAVVDVPASSAASETSAEVATAEQPAQDPPGDTPDVFTDEFGDWIVPPPGSGSEPARPVNTELSADEIVAQINAAVPANYDLSFAWREMTLRDEYVAQALAPVEWDQDDDDYEFDSSDLDRETEYTVETGCQGVCQSQDWQLLMNDPRDSPFRVFVDQPREILVDQALTSPAGRLVVTIGSSRPGREGSVLVELVRWSNGADRFLQCTAFLAEAEQALWPTFADVCIAATGDWLS